MQHIGLEEDISGEKCKIYEEGGTNDSSDSDID
jgi:hypothetical protein